MALDDHAHQSTLGTQQDPQHQSGQPDRRGIGALLGRLSRSRLALGVGTGIAVLAVAGTTLGYRTAGHTVTVTVDGRSHQVTTTGDTVAAALAADHVRIGPHDLVAPAPDQSIDDGTEIAVRYGRPLTLEVDGVATTSWTTATTVDSALNALGSGYTSSRLSTSRGLTIPRGGLTVQVATPKRVVVRLAGHRARPTVGAATCTCLAYTSTVTTG